MGLLRWFAKNWASTDPATHSDLVPLVLPLDTERATEQVRTVVAGMPRWQVEVDSEPGKLHLTRRTRLIGFVDDIRLRFLPAGPGTLIHAESRSRVGIGDLGQNRRNILELWTALRALHDQRPRDR
jgi:uncharacterized protein (DUF1499 family)